MDVGRGIAAGKVAFVTGGAIGFGRAFGRALGAAGASLVVADIDGGAAAATAEEFRAAGWPAIDVTCDVADERAVDAAVARAIDELGGIDILINNAARHLSRYARPFAEQPRDELRGMFDVNIMGVVNCSLACRASMRARGGGSIVNISSIAGYKSTSPYGVSKLAVRGLTIAFATEFRDDNIRVNAIAPGLMATENALADIPASTIARYVDELQLVRRMGTMDDIVAAMMFLCSDGAGFVSGETLKVSGGHPLGI